MTEGFKNAHSKFKSKYQIWVQSFIALLKYGKTYVFSFLNQYIFYFLIVMLSHLFISSHAV